MTNKIKEAAVALLSKSKTLEEATVGFTTDELHFLAEVLEKAKFISPQQQKANRVKTTQESNKAAMQQMSRTPKAEENDLVDPKVIKPKHWAQAVDHAESVMNDKKHPQHSEYRDNLIDSIHQHASDLHNTKEYIDDDMSHVKVPEEEYHAAYNFMKQNPNHPISKKYWDEELEENGPVGSLMWELLEGGDDSVRKEFQKLHGVKPGSHLKVIKHDLLKFNPGGQWDLQKAKFEEKASPQMKRRIREVRAGKKDTLQEKEHSIGGYDVDRAHWRKPKSGEKHIKLDHEDTDYAHHMAGEHSAPKAGKAFVETHGETDAGQKAKIKTHMRREIKANIANIKSSMAKEEGCSYNEHGQWKIEKAIKPGPALDYSAMRPKPDPEAEAKAPTIDYKNMAQPKPTWQQKATNPKESWMKANRAKRERVMAAEKQGIKLDKGEGVLVEEEPTSSEKQRMVAKGEEPHADKQHEAKEKKKAKDIKAKAQEILDLH